MPRTQKTYLELLTKWSRERMPFLHSAENRVQFFLRVSGFLPETDPRYIAIQKAYDDAKEAFREVRRASGERYFEHLRAVALILLEYLEVRDYELIIVAILHDIHEDRPDWPIQRIRNGYGDRVALLVDYLSEPKASRFKSKDAAERAYHARFGFAPRDVFLVKLADRLHNLLTIGARPKEKRLAKIEETRHHYYQYARTHQILLPELREVLAILSTEPQ